MTHPKPTVGWVVHYVARGSADGVYPKTCRAAIVTDVPDGALPTLEEHPGVEWTSDTVVVDLTVFNPEGLFFKRCPDDHGPDPAGGTWHWPERTD